MIDQDDKAADGSVDEYAAVLGPDGSDAILEHKCDGGVFPVGMSP